jgi:hypothetical protein
MPTRFQIDSTKVAKAFLVKFGNCFVLPKVSKKQTEAESLVGEIQEHLNRSSVFQKVEVLHLLPTKAFDIATTERLTGPSSSSLEAVRFTPMIRCSAVLPVKNQDDSQTLIDLRGKEEVDTITKFEILYDGSIYAILREIDLNKHFHPGVYDIRDIFMQAVQKEQSWKEKEIPPNPIRQDFFFVFLVEDQQTKDLIGNTFKEGSIVYCLLSAPRSKDFIKTIASSFQKVKFRLNNYYLGVSVREALDGLVDDLIKLHYSIQSTIEKISKLWYFNISGHYKESKRLEKLVSQHYLYMLNYANELERFKKEANQTERSIEKDPILRVLKDELLEELKPSKVNVDTFSRCAEYAREVAGKSYATKITILGIILTAIGTILGTLILHFLGV